MMSGREEDDKKSLRSSSSSSSITSTITSGASISSDSNCSLFDSSSSSSSLKGSRGRKTKEKPEENIPFLDEDGAGLAAAVASLNLAASSSSITSRITSGASISSDSNCSLFDSLSSSSSLKGSRGKKKKEKPEENIPFLDDDGAGLAAAVASLNLATPKKKQEGPNIPIQFERGELDRLKEWFETHHGPSTSGASSSSKPEAKANVDEREPSKHIESLFSKLEIVKKGKLPYNTVTNEDKLAINPVLAIWMIEFERKGVRNRYSTTEWQLYVNKTISILVERFEKDPMPGVNVNMMEILPRQMALCKIKLEEIRKERERKALLQDILGNASAQANSRRRKPHPKSRSKGRAQKKINNLQNDSDLLKK